VTETRGGAAGGRRGAAAPAPGRGTRRRTADRRERRTVRAPVRLGAGRFPGIAVRVGTDVVDVARLTALLRGQPGLAAEVFTPGELAYSGEGRRREEHLAARFAAKEAVLKALGTGLGPGMRWTDVEVVNDRSGAPRVRLHGAVAAAARRRRLASVEVSLSHTAGLALASAAALAS
jgi:holo-[acyl-carrier protein] synthase